MALGIGGGAQMGLALEVTPGTYVAPTKYFPFNSESLQFQQATKWRRPIRQAVGIVGAVAGDSHVEGEIEMEALEDVVAYFMQASRMTVVKSGATNFTYTGTPSNVAIPVKTMSLTIERVGGVVFGYTGMVVNSFKFSIDEGTLMFTVNMVGRDEASQSVPTPTWPTTTPYGAGQYSLEIPTATPVTDTDTFEFSVEDNASPAFRLKSTGRSAAFINYGERAVTMSMERDFTSRTDYDAFKALTSQSITLTASKGANNSISMVAPVAIKDTYEVTVPGQGDLVRANIAYQGAINGSGADYSLVVKTQEDIV